MYTHNTFHNQCSEKSLQRTITILIYSLPGFYILIGRGGQECGKLIMKIKNGHKEECGIFSVQTYFL